jgi:hypothetical protein
MFQLFLWDIMFLKYGLLCIMFCIFLAFVILVNSHVFIMFHTFVVFVVLEVSTHMFLSCFYHVLYIPSFCYYYSFGTHVSIIFLSCFFHVLYILKFCYSCSFGTHFKNIFCHVSTMFRSFCLIETCLLLFFLSYSRGMIALATLLHSRDEQKQPLCINTR